MSAPRSTKRKRGRWAHATVQEEEAVEVPLSASSRVVRQFMKELSQELEHEFVEAVLAWNAASHTVTPILLHEAVQDAVYRLQPGRARFESIEEYVKAYTALLFAEVAACMDTGLRMYSPHRVFRVRSTRIQEIDTHTCLVHITALVSDQDVDARDWVLLESTGAKPVCRIALVDSVNRNRAESDIVQIRVLGKRREEAEMLLNAYSGLFDITKLDSSTTLCRQYVAIHTIQRLRLVRYVLDPALPRPVSDAEIQQHIPPLLLEHYSSSLNASQVEAVKEASTRLNAFTLLIGPPGSGKTRTILAILNCIHVQRYQQFYKEGMQRISHHLTQGTQMALRDRVKRPRILVCAPSNAAVDEILERLWVQGMLDGQKQTYRPDLVRIGSGSRVKKGMESMMLDAQVHAFLSYPDDEIRNRISFFSHDLKLKERELAIMHSKAANILAHVEESQHEVHLDAFAVQYHTIREAWFKSFLELERCSLVRDHPKERAAHFLRKSILNQAQLVFSTLSSSSTMLFKEANICFDLCLIDEAAQCVEASTLIPLQCEVETCILVGDPKQLPATVLSHGSAAEMYEQSMIQRLASNGHESIVLSHQYRMHPDIAAFPSRFFYEGKLENGDHVCSDMYTKPFHAMDAFQPYLVFSIASVTTHQGTSYNNAQEATFIAKHLKSFLNQCTDVLTIGVITPYTLQRALLDSMLTRHLSADHRACIEIDTVDGFQGREKDVVILSCVRSSSQSSGIGFLSDVRRLNVSLTRAKFALWIVLDASAFTESAPWKALLDDAEHRHVLRHPLVH